MLTALRLEYMAVRAHLTDPERLDHDDGGGMIVEVGAVEGVPWRIAVAWIGPGTLGAAALTERINSWLKPDALFVTGVAGGLKDDIDIGDVVVATKVVDYSGGKESTEGFHGHAHTWDTALRLQQTAHFALLTDDWMQRVPAGHRPATAPNVHFKPIAAGNVVLNASDSPTARRLRKHYQDAAAIEMEGSGAAHAAHLSERLPILIIRGISDRADGTKGPDSDRHTQPLAARHAAAATIATIAQLPPPGRSNESGNGDPGDVDNSHKSHGVHRSQGLHNSQFPAPATPPSKPESRALDALRRAAKAHLDEDFDRHKLGQPAPIPVSWSCVKPPYRPSAVSADDARFPARGSVTQLPELLRTFPRDRRQLVVLGAPGAGKSILARLLAWELLSAWRPGHPVPIVLSLSSWRPTVELQDWMAQRAVSLVPALGRLRRRMRRNLAGNMISDGLIMPILDGLDELPEALRVLATKAIDRAIGKRIPLVVTCRATEYDAGKGSGHEFTSAAVVKLEEVNVDQAITYLKGPNKDVGRWKKVFAALSTQPDAAVSRAFRSPLMLYLAREVYRPPSSTPGELLTVQSVAEIETHLLKKYLPAIYDDHPRFSPVKAKRYLSLIADQVRRDETRDFGWWQLSFPGVAVLVGLLFGAAWGWLFHVLQGSFMAALIGVTTGMVGFVFHRGIRKDLEQVYITEDGLHRPGSSLFRYFRIGCLSGATAAGATALATGALLVWVGADPTVAWYYARIFGLVSGSATLLSSAWGVYFLSHLWFWVTGRLPRSLTAFLRDAHRLGVLREAGTVYQFRHARLEDHLSDSPMQGARSAYTPKLSVGRRTASLLPFVPSFAQFIVPALSVAIVYVMYIASQVGNPWHVAEGEEPRARSEPAVCSGDFTSCPPLVRYTWSLPAGSSRHAVLESSRDEQSVVSWNGIVSADGCDGAAVEVTLSLGDGSPTSFTLSSGSKWDADEHSTRVRFGERPPSVTFRRVDDRPCNVSVEWVDPSFEEDLIATVRNRLNASV
ncbi:hypothetical protein [Streptomyces sp. NPDC001410]|uniref:phosphorylase family protein n=1 Tax=Streptomyces sp. NPDC001410 TaxID=3364574 RepID=UPI00369862D0